MKIHRIYAMVLRYWYYLKHSLDRLSDMFYWPAMDLVIWGLTSRFFNENNTSSINIVFMVISGLLFWILIWRGQYEITVNFLDELWNKNLVNLFVSPLKLGEWVISVFIIGIIKATLSLSFAAVLAFILYKTNFLNYGLYLIPFSFSLILTGWAIGLFITGIIVRYGTRIQTLAWTAVAVVSPFSAIYYPVSSLPEWAQSIARFIPPSYIFENGRNLIAGRNVNMQEVALSFFLNIIYLLISLWFINRSFKKAKDKGLLNVF
jgi:ABC-2 type transport system permease protein